MLKTAEDLVGPYVWGQYDILVLPPSFPYGGMENPCLTFATPTLLVCTHARTHTHVRQHHMTIVALVLFQAGDKSLSNVSQRPSGFEMRWFVFMGDRKLVFVLR